MSGHHAREIAKWRPKRYLAPMTTHPPAPTFEPQRPEGWCVAALYHFARVDRADDVRAVLQTLCDAHAIKGTLLLAREGINGTVAGTDAAIAALLGHLRALPEFAGLEHKESRASAMPFLRMKVKIKSEIVTMGVPDIDPETDAGTYVDAAEWNALITDPDVVVIDTRNDYEVALGTFRNAINPNTATFREFPDWVRSREDLSRKPKIAMFCTGGIRCEKASAFMKREGFDEVYHLKGGILKYLENVAEDDSLWDGECFVFDERVSVGHGLVEGKLELCRACRHPLSEDDRKHPDFEAGVSCPHCHATRTEADRARFREREKQIRLARARGERHLG
jgi:UPF0176 protein